MSYTRVPGRVRHQPHLDVDAHVSFFPLLEIVSPVDPTDSPGDGSIMAASPLGVRLVPDVHMSCFDFLYFVSAGTQEYEWKNRWAPAWRFIGRHLKFTDSLMQLGTAYVRRALMVTSDDLPPVSAVLVSYQQLSLRLTK